MDGHRCSQAGGLERRLVTQGAAAAAVLTLASGRPRAQTRGPEVALYSAVDAALTRFEVDVAAGTLTRRSTVELPAKVQYVWRHPSRALLYATTSVGDSFHRSDFNHVTTLAIGDGGELRIVGEPRPLRQRAVHLCVDPTGRYLANAHNYQGGGITVHRLDDDGMLGEEVPQPAGLPCGIYPHQVRFFPSGRMALLVDRGNEARPGKPEDPGALRTFPFDRGILSPGRVAAPEGGYGFGPRHVDFHPTEPWMYVSDERTSHLYMFRCPGDQLEAQPAYTRDLLAEPRNVRPRQLGSAIHVHPDGRTVYVVNRADVTVAHGSSQVFGGGENNIAVFRIDPASGEPTLVQHVPTQSFHVRTFACDPSGQLLVAGSIKALAVLDGDEVKTVPAALSVFRIGADGRLDFVRKYDVATPGDQLQYWTGMVGLS